MRVALQDLDQSRNRLGDMRPDPNNQRLERRIMVNRPLLTRPGTALKNRTLLSGATLAFTEVRAGIAIAGFAPPMPPPATPRWSSTAAAASSRTATATRPGPAMATP